MWRVSAREILPSQLRVTRMNKCIVQRLRREPRPWTNPVRSQLILHVPYRIASSRTTPHGYLTSGPPSMARGSLTSRGCRIINHYRFCLHVVDSNVLNIRPWKAKSIIQEKLSELRSAAHPLQLDQEGSGSIRDLQQMELREARSPGLRAVSVQCGYMEHAYCRTRSEKIPHLNLTVDHILAVTHRG